MPPSKKIVERHYLDAFARLLSPFPDGEAIPTEEPDFLVVGQDRTIGIELTELHRMAPAGTIPQQASEAMRHRVVARAEQIYVSTGNPPIRCAVHFQDGHIEKWQVEDLASAITELAVRNLPLQNSSTREEYQWTNRDYFPEAINTIGIHRLDAITKNHFFCPGATWVASLTAGDVQRALTAKEEKYAVYRTRCSAAWLLVNADIGSMSTWFQFDAAPLSDIFTSSFDRAFILRHFGGELYELNVAPPIGAVYLSEDRKEE